MDIFKPSAKCPKCKQPEPWVFYRSVSYDRYFPRTFDLLELKCRRCSYSWNVRPADVTDEQEQARLIRAELNTFVPRPFLMGLY